MTVRKVTQFTFGNESSGIEITLSLEEAKAIRIMIRQGFAWPPKTLHNNEDYVSKGIGGELTERMDAITEEIRLGN